MWVGHDRAVIDFAVLLKEARHVRLGEAWVDASHEEIRARVDCIFFFFLLVSVSGDLKAVDRRSKTKGNINIDPEEKGEQL